MNFLKYFPKPKQKGSSKQDDSILGIPSNGKVSFNEDLLKGDLFCHLTYMSAMATSNLPRHLLFQYASGLSYNSSRYLRSVQFMAQKLNYDYSEACRMVGEATKEPEPKAVLLRMAGALASGEKEADFLAREAYAMGESYGDGYQRAIENLSRWTDAYTALILSACLVVVVSLVSMLIFPLKPAFIITLTFVMLASTVLGAWIMYRASPKEVKTHSLPYTSPPQRAAKTLLKFVVAPMAIIVILMLLLVRPGLGWSMLAVAIVILPVGMLAMWDDRQIDKEDSDIAGLLRSLGGITKAIGTTVTEAMGRLDLGSLASLKKQVAKLNNSLILGIRPELCWQRFVGETGSEHVNRSVQIFWDGIVTGGDPQVVGNQSSMFAMKIALLRAKRKSVSSGFSYLCIAMHATLAVLLVGIYQIMLSFSKAIEGMSLDSGSMEGLTQLPTFQFFMSKGGQLQTLGFMVTAMLIMLTIADAVAIKVADGGHNYKYLFYLGVTLSISGLSLLLVPGMVAGVFNIVPTSP